MDAFQGARAQSLAVQRSNYGLAVVLPPIPLWVEDGPKQELASLTLGVIRLILQLAAGRISDNAPVGATGALAQSFGSDPANELGGIEIFGVDLQAGVSGRVFTGLPYAIVVEEGRRAGAPISRAGIDAIGYWAQRKLGLSADEAETAKFAIANSIVAQGIEGKWFVEEAWEGMRPDAEQMLAELGNDIAAAIAATKGPGGQSSALPRRRDNRGRFVRGAR